MNRIAHLAIGTGALAMAATPALAEKARDLKDVNGMQVGPAQNVLIERGFKHISSHRDSRYQVHSYWWDASDDKCVYVTVDEYRNRVENIKDARDQDCGYHKGDDTAAIIGVGVGAALLGALIGGSKSHHEEGKDYSREQRKEFDRGYRDGLHNAAYHNYSRSDAYSHGYEKGVEERQANLRDHKRYGGYYQSAQFYDLKGTRARGGMEELERRGFRQVDNFTSGNTRYSIQWREGSRQCVQVTITDGRFYDINDIGQHPKCR